MKVKKGYLILIGALVIVFAIVFTVFIYILMTPTDFGFTPNTADLIFDFLDKWASASAPALTLLAIIVALSIGVTGILQTRNIQKNEQQHRILKEIEAWAKEVIRFIDEYERGDAERSLWHVVKWQWQILKATKANMQEIARKIDNNFGETVENAIVAFDKLDMNIDKGMKSNISNDMERCRKSCDEILHFSGLLKFKEID